MMALIWFAASLILFVWGLILMVFRKGKRRKGALYNFGGLLIFAFLAAPRMEAENDASAQTRGWANHKEQTAATKAGIADPVLFRKQQASADAAAKTAEALSLKQQADADAAAKVAAAKLEAENNKKGFHCLSQWDGNSADFIALVTARLREPSSFEVMETRITPRDTDGLHQIFMQYRAKNGFGGMNIETALGSVVSATCAVTFIAAE